MRIAMIGTRGVPAQYGGFETAVEEIGSRLATEGHEVVVYCRNVGQTKTEYRGMRLINLPALRRRTLETLSHTILSVLHQCMRPCDAAIVFNAANSPTVPLLRLRRIPVALHVDGLEWQRGKWGTFGRRYYKWCERLSARVAQELIADARAIGDHFRKEYGRETVFLPYGAPIKEADLGRLEKYGVTAGSYHLVVARMEPENHVAEIVEGYISSCATFPLLVVGSVPYQSEYARRVEEAGLRDPRVRMIGSVWDQDDLDALYGGCLSYLHGHSVGGTNPSLLRAMGCAAAVTAYDVAFNQEVVGAAARYFATPDEVAAAVVADEGDREGALKRGVAGQERAEAAYRWDDVAAGYEAMLVAMVDRS